jgi:hypothetical protein
MLLGFYENAFRTIRRVYDECHNRDLHAPYSDWNQAFTKVSRVTVMDFDGTKWTDWSINFPLTDDTPGEERRFKNKQQPPAPWDYVQMILEWSMREVDESGLESAWINLSPMRVLPNRVRKRVRRIADRQRDLVSRLKESMPDWPESWTLLHWAHKFADKVRESNHHEDRITLVGILDLLIERTVMSF